MPYCNRLPFGYALAPMAIVNRRRIPRAVPKWGYALAYGLRKKYVRVRLYLRDVE